MNYDYDMIVIGGGAAGLTASGMSVNFGAKTLLVEKDRLGGDCTWHGCIPSKTLLHFSQIAHSLEVAGNLGFSDSALISQNQIFDKVRKVRKKVYQEADHPSIYEEMGMEIISGSAHFIDDHTLTVQTKDDKRVISSKYIIVATGSSPLIPSIKGLETVPYLTNESLFELTTLPERLTIIGAGPIGVEMAQAFQRLGSEVQVVDVMDRILVKDDPEFSEILKKQLTDEGIQFYLDARVQKIKEEDNQIIVETLQNNETQKISSNGLLIATGREANVGGLKLKRARISFDRKGILVDEHCRTNIKHIFACGDVTGRYQLTHMSEHMAKVAVTNALLKYPTKIDSKHVTWCTFTDPEVAHVGATVHDLQQRGVKFETYRFPYSKLDRAITDFEEHGMIKVFAKKWSGKILGATIIGNRAGDMISEYALAMKNGITLRKIADTIHPYPTYGLGNRRAADQWYVRQQSVGMVKWLKRVFGYRGPLPDVSDPHRIV
ncbi:MAG TPA: FAD-dependent oxidoreductase [Balneolales bacterium]|nr:FAD-dependent oxidoreductase [Balneolales bacterium]